MNTVVLLILGAVGFAGLATALMARRHAWRWSSVPAAAVVVGHGPFRDAQLSKLRPGSVPTSAKLGSVTSILWGLMTALVFAPAGLVFCAIGWDVSVVGTVFVLAVSLHGFALAARLFAGARSLVRGEGTKVASLARASAVHHLAVIASFAVVALAGGDGYLWALAAIPCAVGLAHAAFLGATAKTMDSDHE